jgi:hypothetical protein
MQCSDALSSRFDHVRESVAGPDVQLQGRLPNTLLES